MIQLRHTFLLLPVLLLGCENPDRDWSQDRRDSNTIRPSRAEPAPRPQPSPPAQPAPAPAGTTAAKEPQPASAPGELLHLGLLSGAEPVAGPAPPSSAQRAKVRLHHLAARPCGRILDMLYPALTAGGSRDDFFLIYQDRAAFQAASDYIHVIDAPRPPSAVGTTTPDECFRSAVAALSDFVQHAVSDSQVIAACRDHLTRAASAESAEPRFRWAAAMLAGHVCADFQFDDEAAKKFFQQAERLAPAGSLEGMMAAWTIASALEQAGARDAFADACRHIVATYGNFTDSHIYQRARNRTAASPPP